MEVGSKKAGDGASGARRLVDLKVDEVSVVDRPAIQREFLIRKRVEEQLMDIPNTKEPTADSASPTEVENAETDTSETPAASGNAPTPSSPERSAPGKTSEQEPEGDKTMTKSKDDELDEQPKQKALSLDESNASAFIQVDEDGQLHFVTKSGKAFTARRTRALSEASTKLLGMLKEVDEEAFKSMVQQFVGKEMPRDPGFESGVRPVPTKKSAEPAEDTRPAWAKEIVKQLTTQNERLEAIEKARSPSTSVDAAGGTDDPKKVEKSLWSNVL